MVKFVLRWICLLPFACVGQHLELYYNDYTPIWSPNGRAIIYTGSRSEIPFDSKLEEVYVYDIETGQETQLTRNNFSDQATGWSPDGSEILFISNRDGSFDLYSMNTEGSEVKQITKDGRMDRGGCAAFNREGDRIYYLSRRTGFLDIYAMNLDGSCDEKVLPETGQYSNHHFQISHDRDELIFASNRTGNDRLYVLDLKNKAVAKLPIDTSFAPYYPSITSDGSKIAFLSYKDEIGGELYSVNRDGSGLKRLTNAPDWDFDANYSPDGKKISFSSRREGKRGIFIMDADGTNQKKITAQLEGKELTEFIRRKGIKSAIRYYEKMKSETKNIMLFSGLAMTYLGEEFLKQGRTEEALKLFKLSLEDRLPRWHGRAISHIVKLDSSDFAWNFISNSKEGVINQIGYSFLEKKDYSHALRIFKIATDKFPESANAWDSMGEAYRAVGKNEMAIESFKKAVSLNPGETVRKSATKNLQELGVYFNLDSRMEEIQLTQLTEMDGDETRPRFSPDGKQIIFANAANGRSKIFTLTIADKSVKQITNGTSAEWDPFWFPDGKTIGYSSNRGMKPEMWSQKVGDENTLTKLFTSDSINAFSGGVSSNGESLLFTGIVKGRTFQFVKDLKTNSLHRATSNGDEWYGKWNHVGDEIIYYVGKTDSLVVLNVNTQKSRTVNKGKFNGWHPSFSRISDKVAFISEMSQRWDVWCVESMGGTPRQITNGGWNEFPHWSPVANAMVFSRRNSYNQLFSISINQGKIEQITNATFDMVDFRVGGDDSTLLFGKRTFGDELWMKEGDKEQPLTNNFPGRIKRPVWSPDEKLVLFVNETFQPNTTDVYMVSQNVGDVKRLTSTLSADYPVWVLKDTIHFSSRADDVFQIFKIAVSDDLPIQLTFGPGNKIVTDVSPDGKSILYHSGYKVLAFDTKTQNASELTTGEGASYSHDGRWIAFVSNRNDEKTTDLYVMNLKSKEIKRVSNSKTVEGWPRWSADGSKLYYNANTGDKDIWMAILPD